LAFFLLADYSLNSILYQRGVFPEESFIPTQHYGLTMYMSKNPDIKKYTDEILPHLKRKFILFLQLDILI